MAASRSMQSCCNCFKRLRISPASSTSQAQAKTQSRSFSTSLKSSAETSDESQPKTPRKPTSPLLSLRESVDEPFDRDNSPQQQIEKALLALANERSVPLPSQLQKAEQVRLPRSVQALYLSPLRRTPTHGIPVANLQLRSYSVRNLEFMADFAMRAAYYLNLPAKGPVPLPRITERWTIPRDVFIFKKSQENWERVTLRRLVQIQDGHPEVVQRWLAFVRKWCWYGVGMKANVWEHEDMDVVRRMDEAGGDALQAGMEGTDWELIGRRRGLETADEVSKLLSGKGFGPIGGVSKSQSNKPAAKAKAAETNAAT